MRVLGMLSGTSHDGVDVAVVDFRAEGALLQARIVHVASTPLPATLRRTLLDMLPPASTTFGQVCALDTELGQLFARCATAAGEAVGGVDLVVSHGQTVFHWVDGPRVRGTLQLGQPAWIAAATGVPVLSDVRAADVAAGGQGAPLVPVLDVLLLAGSDECRAALNLGGIANMTVVEAGREPYAYDLGPANALIDAAAVIVTDGAALYDRNGLGAAGGRCDPAMLEDLLAEPFYRQPPPRTTGKELFHRGYLDHYRNRHPSVAGDDLLATATELTARVVAAEVDRCGVGELVVSGGGAANPTLMARIRANCGTAVRARASDELGVPADGKEAVAFALIGYLSAHGLPGNVPSCTGAAGPVVLGALTPPAMPRRATGPAGAAAVMPARLLLES